jgi:hypothetical protein
MFESIKRILGAPRGTDPEQNEDFHYQGSSPVVQKYFELSTAITQHKSDGDFAAAIAAARQTFLLLAEFVRETPDAEMLRSHAVHTAPILMAVMEDLAAIEDLQRTLERIPELKDWLIDVPEAFEALNAVRAMMKVVNDSPGVTQAALKEQPGLSDGRLIARLATLLEKGKRVRRVRSGKSFKLFPYDRPPAPQNSPEAGIERSSTKAGEPSTFASRRAVPAHELNLANVPVVRLPKAPMSWEERAAPDASRENRPARFESEGKGWEVGSEEKLPANERPDPAFREALHTSHGTFWIDPRGKTERFPTQPSVLRVIDRSGASKPDRGLDFDVYRSDVNASGSAILFLSRDGVVHGYTSDLELVIAARLRDIPEFQVQAERLGISPRDVKNHARCVSISSDRCRLLITVVDEAYCYDVTTHTPIWAVRVPIQEGWTRVSSRRSDLVGTDEDISTALRLMELHLPLSPVEVTQQYRKLALRLHPDRNPGDASATARFQALGNAYELLTGIDVRNLSLADAEVISYQKALHEVQVAVPGGGSVGISFATVTSEKGAADWIYAANFAPTRKGAYLATYSGKVIRISEDGTPKFIYDIGSVPRHIEEVGRYLYLLTDTRLYVVDGDRLTALVDVFDRGDLIIGDTGFGLLEPKSFSWFTPTGERLGRVRSKDPLRRVMSTERGLVVETRQHRVNIPGAQSWWEALP